MKTTTVLFVSGALPIIFGGEKSFDFIVAYVKEYFSKATLARFKYVHDNYKNYWFDKYELSTDSGIIREVV